MESEQGVNVQEYPSLGSCEYFFLTYLGWDGGYLVHSKSRRNMHSQLYLPEFSRFNFLGIVHSNKIKSNAVEETSNLLLAVCHSLQYSNCHKQPIPCCCPSRPQCVQKAALTPNAAIAKKHGKRQLGEVDSAATASRGGRAYKGQKSSPLQKTRPTKVKVGDWCTIIKSWTILDFICWIWPTSHRLTNPAVEH